MDDKDISNHTQGKSLKIVIYVTHSNIPKIIKYITFFLIFKYCGTNTNTNYYI